MPAIQVARTDTFEQQRQKINQIGSSLFNITAGGSDLSTGNLKLGDGTINSPSLAFVSNPLLGVYKPSANVMGFVNGGKKIIDFGADSSIFYRDIVLQKKSLDSLGLQITNTGTNYDTGSYAAIPVVGGSGNNATLNIEVVGFTGSITNTGSGYNSGTYQMIPLTGGSGSGAEITFTVSSLGGSITNAGSGYVGGSYSNVPLTGGSGTGATANITVSSFGSTTVGGNGYPNGTFLSVPLTGGSGTGAKAKLIVQGGVVQAFGGAGSSLSTPGNGYVVGDSLTTTFPVSGTITYTVTASGGLYYLDGVQGSSFSLLKGKTYVFNANSISGHPLYIGSTADNTANILGTADGVTYTLDGVDVTPANYLSGFAAATTRTVTYAVPVAAVGPVYYNCSLHPGMGGSLTLVTPTTGNGFNVTIDTLAGAITNVSIVSSGNGYAANDILSVSNTNLGGSGSGFQYTISGNSGQITNITSFDDYGTGYSIGDILTLPSAVTNVSTYLKGAVDFPSITLNSASTIITLPSTTGVFVGDSVDGIAGNPLNSGQLVSGTTVLAINGNQITLSVAPSQSGTLDIRITNANRTKITVADTTGIQTGWTVTKVSGTGSIVAGTTVTAIDSPTVLSISQQPTIAGSAVLNFSPSYGSGSNFSYTINQLGVVDNISVADEGNGYSIGDVITVSAFDLVQPIEYPVTNKSLSVITFTSATLPANTFSVGNYIKTPGGGISSAAPTSSTTLAGQSNGVYNNLSPSSTSGNGSGATFNIFRNNSGAVTQVSVVTSGVNYAQNDTITIPGNLIGGSSPVDDLIITVNAVTPAGTNTLIYEVNTSGGYVTNIVTDSISVNPNSYIVKSTSSTLYQVNTSDLHYRYFIDIGNGPEISPDLVFFTGNTYTFDLSDASNNGHIFALSKFKDGQWSPSLVENITTTLSALSPQITVGNTSGIVAGMIVEETGLGVGSLAGDTKVLSVDSSTQITLDKNPTTSGSVTLKFYGSEYLDGVTRTASSLSIKVTSNTPSPLYYFCDTDNPNHANESGFDNAEAVITIGQNNPKVFGSGLQISVTNVTSENTISTDIIDGEITAVNIVGTSGSITTLNNTTLTSSNATLSTKLRTPLIDSISNLTIEAAAGSNINLGSSTGNLINFGEYSSLQLSTGNITTSGSVKTSTLFNSNDKLIITDNYIESLDDDIILQPFGSRVAKVLSTTALTIPVGSTSQRPTSGIVSSGSIRFNTDTNQYEGYSGATSSWSSLGGVRDLDGNTYITAELSIGSNDNTLWFYNDNINTVKFTPEYQEFVNVKKIRSVNATAPAYIAWNTNTPVTTGQYLKYRNNIYEVVTSGTTGTSGSEPTDTTGNNFTNGTSTLKFFVTAVAPLTFEEISEVRIAPVGGTSLSINSDLRFANNVISTDVNDLLLRPNTGKKVTIDAKTSLVIPVGTTNERGAPIRGSVRFNSTILQYEGYDGINWSSLGGVRDVDGNTYIIPELSAGSDENTLYFYNNGSNTLRVTENGLIFESIDTLTSPVSNTLNLNAELVAFNNLAASIDTSSADTTFISTTKDNLDLGLSSGLVNDPLLRLSDTGDIYYNLGFGTGIYNGVKIFDNELKELELADYKISTTKVDLNKGTVNSGSAILYTPSVHESAKVQIIAHNTVTGDKEFIEYSVIDKGTDIFFTDFGNVKTGAELISCTFDFNASNNVRVTFTLDPALAAGNLVEVTVISNIIKR